MKFAIKINGKYLKAIEPKSVKGHYEGNCSNSIDTEKAELITEDKPIYFTSKSVASKVGILVDNMRWGDIEQSKIEIIPKEETE